MGRCIIVDENDAFIRLGMSDDIADNEFIRITAIWITSPEGKILFAKRSHNKKHEPNLWSLAVAGTVEPHEQYEQNAYKELEEELGITGVTLRQAEKRVFMQRVCQWFYAVIPEETVLHPNLQEVDETRWVTVDELDTWFHKYPE